MALRFFTGDENGFVKSVKCKLNTADPSSSDGVQVEFTTIDDTSNAGSVHQMALGSAADGQQWLAVARGNGETRLHTVDKDKLATGHTITEPNFKPETRFVGLGISQEGTYTCTSQGRLRFTPHPNATDLESTSSHSVSLPNRLTDLRWTSNFSNFAYGGNEVELSVWDTRRAFSSNSADSESIPTPATGAGMKRKKAKNAELLPGEIWRARNVANDMLNLRQPVHITSLTFMSQDTSPTGTGSPPYHHFITGSKSGAVRRYDTRTSRRPVANWETIGKLGGVKHVQCGLTDNQVFVSDNGSNLFALDTRTGKALYSYKGIAGAITSVAPTSTNHLASVSLDRFFRLHTAAPPPEKDGGAQASRGEVLSKSFAKSTPTVVLWDGDVTGIKKTSQGGEDAGDDVWDDMGAVRDYDDDDDGRDSDDEDEPRTSQPKSKKKRRL